MVEQSPDTNTGEPPAKKFAWDDITANFLNSVQEANLKPGELITLTNEKKTQKVRAEDGNLVSNSLAQAMSAMEMMEPKMDASQVYKSYLNHQEIPLTFEQAKKLKLASTRTTETEEQIITVFDTCANYFSRYLEGDYYQSSLGSCVYNLLEVNYLKNWEMQHPEQKGLHEDDTVCYHVSNLFRVCSKMCLDLISYASIQEEEDFYPFDIFNNQIIDSDFHSEKIEEVLKFKYTDPTSPVYKRLKLLILLTELLQYLHHVLQASSANLTTQFCRAVANYCKNIKLFSILILNGEFLDTKTGQEKDSSPGKKLVKVNLKTRKDLIFGFDKYVCYRDMQGGFPRPSNLTCNFYCYKWLTYVMEDVTNSIILSQASKLSSITEMGWSFSRKSASLLPRSLTVLLLSMKLIMSVEDQKKQLFIDAKNEDSNLRPLYSEIDTSTNQNTESLIKMCLDDLYLMTNKALLFRVEDGQA